MKDWVGEISLNRIGRVNIQSGGGKLEKAVDFKDLVNRVSRLSFLCLLKNDCLGRMFLEFS